MASWAVAYRLFRTQIHLALLLPATAILLVSQNHSQDDGEHRKQHPGQHPHEHTLEHGASSSLG